MFAFSQTHQPCFTQHTGTSTEENWLPKIEPTVGSINPATSLCSGCVHAGRVGLPAARGSPPHEFPSQGPPGALPTAPVVDEQQRALGTGWSTSRGLPAPGRCLN